MKINKKLNLSVFGAQRLASKLAVCGCLIFAIGETPGQVTSNWTTNANSTLGLGTNWSDGIPNGVGDIANFNNNATANRTITNDLGTVIWGELNFANTNTGDFGYTITGGTIQFENTGGAPAVINSVNAGGANGTINSDMIIVDQLDINLNAGVRNSRGLTLGTTGTAGVISGGTSGQTTIRINSTQAEDFSRWVIIRGDNTFAGQILVESGHLRLETRASSAGLQGVGNEVIVTGTGRVDLRNVNFAPAGDLTQIFEIDGIGPNGLGALVNSTGTGTLAHLILNDDATAGGQSVLQMIRRRNSADDADIAPILDFGGNTLTKLGISEFRVHNGDMQNTAGAVLNIHEGYFRFYNLGALEGGTPGDYGNNIDGMTINVNYVPGAFDGVNPLNGSRTSDVFNPNRSASDTAGYGTVVARVAFRTDWGTGNTHAANTKVVEVYDNVTFNMNYGVFQRDGNTEVGRTFDHIFETGTTFNLVGGTVGQNIFSIANGSGSYNADLAAYDHPGVTEIRGQIDNGSPGNEGHGLTKRGNRELRLSHANPNFNGDVLIKQNTARWMPGNYTNASGAHESQYFSMSLSGADGSLNQANSIELTRWGSLALLNSDTEGANNRGGHVSANNNDRLNDGGLLNFRNGILYLETHSTDTNTENMGNVVADLGTNYIYLDTRAGGAFDGAVQSITRNNSGVLKLGSMNPDHSWGTGPADEVRLAVNDATGISTVGADNPGNPDQRVVQGVFGMVPPEFAERTGGAVTRSDHTMQQAAAFLGVGMGLMTLENVGGVDYLRPLTADEHHFGAAPLAGSNWVLNEFIQPADGPFGFGDRRNYAERQITADTTVNSLTIAWDSVASGQDMLNTERDYLIIEQGSTLKIDSGIINFATLAEVDITANATASIRGGLLDMNGQAAIINSAITRHLTNSTSGTSTTFLAGNSAYMRSPMTHVTDLVKTGRNSLYLDTWNDLTGNIYVGEQGSLIVRHPGALGEGASGREVVVGGAGNFLLEYGTNITGINLRASNSFDTSRVLLRNEGATHSTWGGDVIFDTADTAGSTEFQNHVITARNNGTLSIYGNIYTDNNANFSDNTAFNQSALMSTAIGETATINLFGQVRDTVDGALANVGDTGDSATRLSRAHSMAFQMRGHNEINVNAHQQWNATGAIFATQGYFRIAYDPAADGLDGTGFQTEAARAAITQNNTWNDMWLGGPQNSLGVANSATNAYHGHIMLTRPDQVLNWGQRVQVSNNNRNHTLTLGGEHHSGTAYIGSVDNSYAYRVFFQNSNTERDLRFLQAAGGTLVVNARLEDGNTTADSFNSTISMVGPGTVVFNRNSAGSSTVDRWNFMAGTTVWGTMTGNNQFARTRVTGTNARASVSTWGGGNLILDSGNTTARTQTLDGDIYLLNGASSVTVTQGKTFTMGRNDTTRSLTRRSGSSLAFLEDGNGAININVNGLTTEAGEFLGTWGVYGSTANGVTDWAGRQSTTGVQAFADYTDDVFGGVHTNLTTAAALAGDESADTLRFGAAVDLDIGAGNTLTLERGGLLVPASLTDDIRITGGALTSGWLEGGSDLMLYNFGQGVTRIDSVISNQDANKVNLVLAGAGTTVLEADNTLTGSVYLNNGVLQISSDSQLGQVNGSIERIVLVGPGSSYSSGASGVAVTFEGGDGTGAAATFNTVSSSTASSRVVNNITVTDGGSGYTTGVRVRLEDGTGTNAGAWAVLDSGNLHFDGGVLHATESFALNSGRTMFLGGNGGTLRVDPGKTLTIDGFISGEYNHVHAANGYNNSNSLGNAWDASSVRNPDIGDLTIDGGGTVVFRYSPLGDGSTPGNLAHAYGGTTWINEGVLRLEGVGSTGATGALGTHNSFIDGTVIGAGGSLDFFFASSDPSIQEWFILRGDGYQGGGTFTSTVPHGSRVYNLAGQIHVEEDALFNVRNGREFRVNSGGGDMFGSGAITRVGNGILRLRGNNPNWTGELNLVSGSNYIDSVGSLGGMTGLTLQRNALLLIGNGTTTVDEFRDRLPDNLPISSNGWTRLRMDATGGAHSGVEKVGTLTVQAGVMGIEYNLGSDIAASAPRLTGDWAGWHFDEIIRETGSIVAVRNLDAGTGIAGADFGQVAGNMQNQAVLLVDNAPDHVGGDGSSFNHNIVPGFFGGTRELWSQTGANNLFTEEGASRYLMTVETGTHPVTGDPVNYIRPLTAGEFRVFGSDAPVNQTTPDSTALDDAGATGQNVLFVGRTADSLTGEIFTGRRNSTLTLGQNESINSLSVMTESYINGGGGSRGNTAAILLDDLATLEISSGVINVSNIGVQDRAGAAHSTGTNADIRTFIRGGSLDFNGREAIIQANSRWIHYNTTDAVDAFREVDVDNTQVFINSSITNTGGNGLTKTGANSVYLQVANQYTGDTNITHGLLYARHNQALGQSERVVLSGSGGFVVGLGAEISDVDLYIGALNGNTAAFFGEQGSIFNGNIIVDNVDMAGSTSYVRSFTPRIYNNSSSLFTLNGDIYGGATPVAEGIRATESRMFSTYTGAQGIFNLRGRIMDNEMGALDALVTEQNQNQVLRMEILDTTSENNIQLWQPYESAGRIRLLRGVLRFMGDGNFYSDDAISAINPDNEMSGFQMGGRGVANTAGTGAANLALVLANPGAVFNLSSWEVGVESTDRDNASGNDNFNRGNTTGNRTLAGENRSGTVTFGTGAGGITFVNDERFGGYDAPLQLYAAEGGRVDIRAAFLDGGDGVNSSITKSGLGEVRLFGSTLGDSTVEAVNVLGGFLTMQGYDANANRRVGQGAALVLGGGGLVLNAGATPFTEDLGAVTVNTGGSAVVSVGAGILNISGGFTRNAGGQVHFQSIAGGVINATGVAADSRLGSWATFGANLATDPFVTDWAATDGSGQVVAFAGYADDAFAPGNHTDVLGGGLTAGTTGSVRFNSDAGTITGGTLALEDGGLLVTSNYTGGTPVGAGVGISATGDLIIHNFATGEVTLAGDISGSNVVFNGTGRTLLAGTNSHTGTTFITGDSTVVVDDLTGLGSSAGLHLNGGALEITAEASTQTFSMPLTLGGNDGTLRVTDADSRLIIRGAATNLISSESNPVASVTTSPFNGGLKIEGSGTVQYGDRSSPSATQDLLGVNNNYTGHTTIGDGVNPVQVEIQGQVNDNGQISPFGTHVGWTDSTLVRNNATVEFGVRRGNSGRTGQVRVREWFEWGETADDVVSLLVSTQREVALEGINKINGTLEITVQNQNYTDRGEGGLNGQTSVYFGLNEGSVIGDGRIIIHPEANPAGNTYGTIQIRDSIPDFTGDIEVRNGYLAVYGLGYTQGTGTTPILVGTEGATNGHRVDVRLLPENGTNGSSTITTAFDAPTTDLTFYRDIRVADNTNQDVRLYSGYIPANGFLNWTGNIDVGNSPGQTIRFYYEDTENLDPLLAGHQQHVIMRFSGDISGNRRLLLDANEGGDINQTLPVEDGGRSAADVHRAIFTTYLLGGDNSGFTGDVRISAETGLTVIDKDDIPILRFGSDLALTEQNDVIMQTLSGLQAGGHDVTIGGLSTVGGTSTSGMYSFIDYEWASFRESLYDLDHVVTGTQGSTGMNIRALGGSSEIIENASATPGTLTITQNVNATWDAYFRDGNLDPQIDGASGPGASLSVVKAGSAMATMTIFNTYSGTTTVSGGALQIGQGGNGEWQLLVQGNSVARTAVGTGNRAVGSTGLGLTTVETGAMLTGSGHVRGSMVVQGTLAPGDVLGAGDPGSDLGTLFVGGQGSGIFATVTIEGGTLTLQALAPTTNNFALSEAGTYTLNDLVNYEAYVSGLPTSYDGTAVNPTTFGELGTHITAGTQHDHLEVSNGFVWNGGLIEVVPFSEGLNSFSPQAGDIYNLLDWYGVSEWNDFDEGDRYRVGGETGTNLFLPDLSSFGEALRWDTGLFTSHGILLIAVVPEPSRMLLLFLGFATLLMRRRR